MRIVRRLTVVVASTAAVLVLGTALLTPEVDAVLSAHTSSVPDELTALAGLAERSLVYARDGSLLAVLHAEENRSPVSLEQVPRHVVDAVIDVEDERFWRHGGVDLRATTRALMTNLSAGGVRQGGSTITQQLVKNAIVGSKKTANRKVREAVLAVRLEDRLSKQEILERYLNTVYFGNGAYGVQAAAETYFGVGVEQLTPGQGAFLAGLIRNPVGYDPVRNPEAARGRRDLALDRMVVRGHLERAEADRLKQEPVPTAVQSRLPRPDDHFVEEVKQRLFDDERLGDTRQERIAAVFTGGLRIHTTLDPKMQASAEDKVRRLVPETEEGFTGALVALDPRSGAVRALVSGRSFDDAKFNLVTQGRRQPGSSFKTFVLVAALEAGRSPLDRINGSEPCRFRTPVPGEIYEPGNYEGTRGGVVTLVDATAKSLNCAFVRLGQNVGLTGVVDAAKRMGIASPLSDQIVSLPLGSMEVTPLEMAAAYGVLANDGVRHEPRFIDRVVDRDGTVIFDDEADAEGERVLAPQTARVATQALQAVVQRGTGTRARLADRPVAGKTGTAQEHTDAWFVGFTPQLATAVWMGAPVAKLPMRNVGGIRVTGGSYPARIWRDFMTEALDGEPVIRFEPPDPRLIKRGTYLRDDGTIGCKVTKTSKSRSRSDSRSACTTTTTRRPATRR